MNRFENVPNSGSPGIALDTVTGQWCRTWDWHDLKGNSKSDLGALPTCLSLYKKSAPSETVDYIFKDGKLVKQ